MTPLWCQAASFKRSSNGECAKIAFFGYSPTNFRWLLSWKKGRRRYPAKFAIEVTQSVQILSEVALKVGLISESFSLLLKSPKRDAKSLSILIVLRVVIWHPFWRFKSKWKTFLNWATFRWNCLKYKTYRKKSFEIMSH